MDIWQAIGLAHGLDIHHHHDRFRSADMYPFKNWHACRRTSRGRPGQKLLN